MSLDLRVLLLSCSIHFNVSAVPAPPPTLEAHMATYDLALSLILCSKYPRMEQCNILHKPTMQSRIKLKGVLHLLPKKAPKLAYLLLYFKIINIFLNNNLCILW